MGIKIFYFLCFTLLFIDFELTRFLFKASVIDFGFDINSNSNSDSVKTQKGDIRNFSLFLKSRNNGSLL